MGWKRVKEHFSVNHIVQVSTEGICIGSQYIHNLATINPTTGAIRVNEVSPGFLAEYYPLLNAASPDELVRLIEEPDSFSASVTVFTYEGAKIIEKLCEKPGWPNVTHDGCTMPVNKYSTDKQTVVEWARRNATCAIEIFRDRAARVERDLLELRAQLSEYEADKAMLDAEYPASAVSPEST